MAERPKLTSQQLQAAGIQVKQPGARPKLTAETLESVGVKVKAPATPTVSDAALLKMADSYMTMIAGTAAGIDKLHDGIKQFGYMVTDTFGISEGAEQKFTEETAAKHKAYALGADKNPAFNQGVMVGENAALAAIPAGAATVVGRAAAGAAIGTGIGATEYVDEDESRARNTVEGAVFGGVASLGADAVVGAIGTIARKLAKDKVGTAEKGWVKSTPKEGPESPEDLGLKGEIQKRLAARVRALKGSQDVADQAQGQLLRNRLEDTTNKPIARVKEQTEKEAKAVFEAQRILDDLHTNLGKYSKEGLNPQESLSRSMRDVGIVSSDMARLTDLALQGIKTTKTRGIKDIQRQSALTPSIKITPDMPVAQAAKIYHNTLANGTMVKSSTAPVKGLDDLLGRMTTTLRLKSPRVAYRVRQLDGHGHQNEMDNMLGSSKLLTAMESIRPSKITQKFRKGRTAENKALNAALIRQDWDEAHNILRKYDGKVMKNSATGEKFTFRAREALDETQANLRRIWVQKKEAGIEVGFVEDYFPRVIKDMDQFMYQFDTNTRHSIKKEIDDAAKKKGSKLTDLEQATIANRAVKGAPKVAGVGGDKSRKILHIPTAALSAYDEAGDALLHYLRASGHEVAKAKYLGKASTATSTEGSIGELIAKELELKNITPKEAEEIAALLHTRDLGGDQAPGKATQGLRNLYYASLLGHVQSAIQNLTDVGTAGAVYGFRNAAISAIKTVLPKGTGIKMGDIGLNQLVQEMSETRGHARFLNTVFTSTGFKRLDRLGKEVILNSSWRQMQKQVTTTKGLEEFQNKWVPMVGEQGARNMVRDIRAGKVSPDVKDALWFSVADLSPVSLSEMAPNYMRMKNGRILYALKTYQQTAWDVYRREVINTAKVDPKKAAKNLIRLQMGLMAMGVPVAATIAFMDGKPMPEMSDAVFGTWLKQLGLTSYLTKQYEKGEKPSSIALQSIVPPIGLPLDIVADMERTGSAWPLVKALPYGKSLYNWFGGGAEKALEKKEKDKATQEREMEREQSGEDPKGKRLTAAEKAQLGLE